MLKANRGVLWMTRECKVTWCSGMGPKDWQTGVIILIHKGKPKSIHQLPKYLTHCNLSGKVDAYSLEKNAAK